MRLIFPPVAKPCEPPAGTAKLAGALQSNGIACSVLDANLEGLLYLLDHPASAPDTWSRRALKNIAKNVSSLRDSHLYRLSDRYSRAVKDVNRVLEITGAGQDVSLSLADYQDRHLSPVRSGDLIEAAAHPERNVFYPFFKKRLPEVMEKVVGFSLNYLSQALCTFAMIGFIRKEYPQTRIVLGGGLVTSWMKNPKWTNPFTGLIDNFVRGPGEIPLLNVLGVREIVQQKHFAPDYDSLSRNDYFSPGFILPYSGASGCYWNKCSFCPETAEDNPYIPVPVKDARSDLAGLIGKTNPVLVHLLDNAVSPALMGAVVEKPLGVSWYGFARIGRELLDPDYCIRLRESGCVMLKLGLESGDQSVLDKMRKGIDLKTASRVLKNLQTAGIGTYVYLLFGTPAETIVEARRTLDFVVAHRDAVSFLNLAIFNMPKFGQEAGEYEREEFYDGDLSLYTGFRHPRGWNRGDVRRFLDAEFKRHPAVAAILKNDPPIFTSNHAALLSSSVSPR